MAKRFTVQSIVVKRGPRVRTRAAATRIAHKFGSVRTSRATSTSYRFRQRPPKDFSRIRGKKISGTVTLVGGPLKKR